MVSTEVRGRIPVGSRSQPRTAFISDVFPRLNRPTTATLIRSSARRANSTWPSCRACSLDPACTIPSRTSPANSSLTFSYSRSRIRGAIGCACSSRSPAGFSASLGVMTFPRFTLRPPFHGKQEPQHLVRGSDGLRRRLTASDLFIEDDPGAVETPYQPTLHLRLQKQVGFRQHLYQAADRKSPAAIFRHEQGDPARTRGDFRVTVACQGSQVAPIFRRQIPIGEKPQGGSATAKTGRGFISGGRHRRQGCIQQRPACGFPYRPQGFFRGATGNVVAKGAYEIGDRLSSPVLADGFDHARHRLPAQEPQEGVIDVLVAPTPKESRRGIFHRLFAITIDGIGDLLLESEILEQDIFGAEFRERLHGMLPRLKDSIWLSIKQEPPQRLDGSLAARHKLDNGKLPLFQRIQGVDEPLHIFFRRILETVPKIGFRPHRPAQCDPFLTSRSSGMEPSCITTAKTTTAWRDTSYNNPMKALPRNHDTPYTALKIP